MGNRVMLRGGKHLPNFGNPRPRSRRSALHLRLVSWQPLVTDGEPRAQARGGCIALHPHPPPRRRRWTMARERGNECLSRSGPIRDRLRLCDRRSRPAGRGRTRLNESKSCGIAATRRIAQEASTASGGWSDWQSSCGRSRRRRPAAP